MKRLDMAYDSRELAQLIELHKKLLHDDKRRLGLLLDSGVQHSEAGNENPGDFTSETEIQTFCKNTDDKEEKSCQPILNSDCDGDGQNFPLVEQLDLSSCNGSLEKDKQAFIHKLENLENPLTFRSDEGSGGAMLRYGEYSPNNPQLRVAAAPYLGLGEYEQRRQLISKQRQADYKEHISRKNDLIRNKVNTYYSEDIPDRKGTGFCKAVQTDIQNIHNRLVQYELHSQNPPEKELSPQPVNQFIENNNNKMHNSRSPLLNRVDQRLTTQQNTLLRPETSKPKSILSTRRTETPRDLHHSYVPSFLDGFSYQEDKTEFRQKERLKCETYQAELRQQIEEKRRLVALRDEHERREQELANLRLEQQLLKMEDDQYRSKKHALYRRTSDDLKSYRDEQPVERPYRKHSDSESSVTSLRNTKVASRQLSHYSPPVSRKVPYSFNIPSTSVFANPTNRYTPSYYDNYRQDSFTRRNFFSRSESVNRDEPRSRSNSFNRHESVLNRHESLSRIDSLQRQDSLSLMDSLSIKDSISRIPRRHSATQQDLSLMRRSPKSQRSDRSSCSRLDDTLPIPVLKAHSPVAKDLKNSVAIDSSKYSSEALRKLEDRWQIPAVQKNIISQGDPHREGHSRSILTQLGAIRMQLQKEQLRMDETLRKRGISQPKAV